MKPSTLLLLLALTFFASTFGRAQDAKLLVVDKVRFLPLKGHEQDVIGATILGSNTSPDDGFVQLGQIATLPADGQWGELALTNTTPYRWIKYLSAPGSHGRVAKLEFYGGDTKVKANEISSNIDPDVWRNALNDNPNGNHQSEGPDGNYVVIDTLDAATGPPTVLDPGPGFFPDPVTLQLKASQPGATIRYTLDGTDPTLDNGQVYSAPLRLNKTTTISAATFVDGHAPTPWAWGSYIIGTPPKHESFDIGNSLTGITGRFDFQARSAGLDHHSDRLILGGGLTKALWNAAFSPIGDPANKDQWISLYSTTIGQTIIYKKDEIERVHTDWEKLWPTVKKIDNITLQPRDFDIPEEADYDNRFLALLQQKSPDAQPWLYVEWDERDRHRPTDLGKEPTSEMKQVFPALTWEESMSAMCLYGEDLLREVNKTYKGSRPVKIIPACLAVGWLHNQVAQGQFPGVGKDEFYKAFFNDGVHLSPDGAYLVDCMFYAAFYGQTPEDKFLPLLTHLTPAQAKAMQQLAWNTMKNYPASGLYEEGTTPVEKPQISPAGPAADGATPMTLTSATPGAWFRYTLDGTDPTRTNGYVFCGVVSARPGMTVKAIAYKSGMADSPVVQVTAP